MMPIYLDHNATTPLDPRVREAMLPFLGEQFGNPSSASHAYGWQAQAAVKKAREQVAALLGCRATDILWTSGATESNNMAILGVVRTLCAQKPHIITQATEHKAVLQVCEAATEFGAEVTVLDVDADGRVDVQALERAIKPNTVMISIMTANNEIGTVQPMREIGAIAQKHRLIFHSDGAQSAGKVHCDLSRVDMLSLSGHKLYGPKGIGALMVRQLNREFELKPLMFGGEQERALRPGTLNVPAIVGLGMACELARLEGQSESERLTAWRDRMIDQVCSRFPRTLVNGSRRERLCNNVNLSFPGLLPDDMILGLSGLAYSSGSACNSSSAKGSHVLSAIGRDEAASRAVVRLGLGRFTTADEVAEATDKLLKLLEKHWASARP